MPNGLFSTLLQDGTFDFGLSPLAIIVIVLVIIFAVWWTLKEEAEDDALHEAPHGDHDDHGHEDHAHSEEAHAAAPAMEEGEEEPQAEAIEEAPVAAAMAETVEEEAAAAVEEAPAEEEPAPAEETPAAAETAAMEEKEPQALEAEEAAPAAEEEKPAAPPKPDDLKMLEGIGPKVAGLLNQNGITSFRRLAETDVSVLNQILDAAGYSYMNPGSWPDQAKLAAEGDWEALKTLQDNLTGGR